MGRYRAFIEYREETKWVFMDEPRNLYRKLGWNSELYGSLLKEKKKKVTKNTKDGE